MEVFIVLVTNIKLKRLHRSRYWALKKSLAFKNGKILKRRQFLCIIFVKGSENQGLKKRHNMMGLQLGH
jgi:hypothetical protein